MRKNFAKNEKEEIIRRIISLEYGLFINFELNAEFKSHSLPLAFVLMEISVDNHKCATVIDLI